MLTILLFSLGIGTAQAQLNDSGQDACYNGSDLVACMVTNTGDTATYPRQDGRFGRDAAAASRVLLKTGSGAAGFDFTKICMSGELAGQGSCPADPPAGAGANDWACTKDNVTNLIWSLDSPFYNWTEAVTTYPAAMNTTSHCGYNTGWRTPTRRELLSIVHSGKATGPAIDTDFFPSSGFYWSIDTYAPAPAYAWYVNFSDGNTSADKKATMNRVRLVRGPQTFPAFSDNGDGTVTDDQTGLIWDKCSWGQTWDDSRNNCTGAASIHNWASALTTAVTANRHYHRGYNDWRPPARNELESLVDLSSFGPAINTTAFPNTPSDVYWSATTYAPAPAQAWIISFNNGVIYTYGRTINIHVRLVRSGQSLESSDLLGSVITATANPPAGGMASCAPNPVSRGSNSACTATPKAGYSFVNWGGDCAGPGTCILRDVTAPKNVTANFTRLSTIPALGPWGLSLLASLLAGVGVRRNQWRRPHLNRR